MLNTLAGIYNGTQCLGATPNCTWANDLDKRLALEFVAQHAHATNPFFMYRTTQQQQQQQERHDEKNVVDFLDPVR